MTYKPKRGRKSERYLGFSVSSESAPALFIVGLLVLIGDLIWGVFILLGLLAYLSWMSYTQSIAGTQSLTFFGGTTLMFYVAYLVVWVLLLIFSLYTIQKARKLQGK